MGDTAASGSGGSSSDSGDNRLQQRRERGVEDGGEREVKDEGIFVQYIQNTYLSGITKIISKYQWHRYKYVNSNGIF